MSARRDADYANVRFWASINGGWVKLTLSAGESLHWSQGGPTDEGWHSEAAAWSYDGFEVHRENINDGEDCDGRLSHFHESFCKADDLCAAAPYDPGDGRYLPPGAPDWTHGEHRQRDYRAEAAGY